jgi:hypothetical protein
VPKFDNPPNTPRKSMASSHSQNCFNTHESTQRYVLRYPVDGSEPHVVKMTFSMEGAQRPYAFYTTALDLRAAYGTSLYATRSIAVNFQSRSLSSEGLQGEYSMMFNIDPKLPINRATTKLLGVDPRMEGTGVSFRGDLYFVKHREWPESVRPKEGFHVLWLDVIPQLREYTDMYLAKVWTPEKWKKWIQEERAMFPGRDRTDVSTDDGVFGIGSLTVECASHSLSWYTA